MHCQQIKTIRKSVPTVCMPNNYPEQRLPFLARGKTFGISIFHEPTLHKLINICKYFLKKLVEDNNFLSFSLFQMLLFPINVCQKLLNTPQF